MYVSIYISSEYAFTPGVNVYQVHSNVSTGILLTFVDVCGQDCKNQPCEHKLH